MTHAWLKDVGAIHAHCTACGVRADADESDDECVPRAPRLNKGAAASTPAPLCKYCQTELQPDAKFCGLACAENYIADRVLTPLSYLRTLTGELGDMRLDDVSPRLLRAYTEATELLTDWETG